MLIANLKALRLLKIFSKIKNINTNILFLLHIYIQRPVTQSLFKKFDFGNSSQKSRKNKYQTFLFLSIITGFVYSVPNTLSGIAIK